MISQQDPTKIRHILIVDDDPVSLRYFTACLPKMDYQCSTCTSVDEAQSLLEKAGTASFDCLVTDYLMPERDGMDLLNWLADVDSTLGTIVITSGSQRSLLTQTLRVGATDFLEKPVARQTIIDAVAKACLITEQRRALSASHQALQDLAHMRDLFLNLDTSNCRMQVTPKDVLYFPKYELGGDFVDLFEITPSRKVILCGDVSGHDLKAAYVSAYFQGMVCGLIKTGTPVREIIDFFNDALINRLNKLDAFGKGSQALFSVSTAFFIIDEKENRLQILNCGLPIPYYSDGEGMVRSCQASSQPLGWFDKLDLSEVTLDISHIQKLYIYTDGFEDLADAFEVNLFSLAYRLFTEPDMDQQKYLIEPAMDDVLMMRLRMDRKQNMDDFFTPLLFQELKAGTHADIDKYQAYWEKSFIFASSNVPFGERLMDILLCCREVVLNGLTHGCEGKPDSVCHFQVTFNKNQKILRIRADDPGDGFDFDIATRIENLDKLEHYHFGLVMLQSMADKMIFERNGATIVLDFKMNEVNV